MSGDPQHSGHGGSAGTRMRTWAAVPPPPGLGFGGKPAGAGPEVLSTPLLGDGLPQPLARVLFLPPFLFWGAPLLSPPLTMADTETEVLRSTFHSYMAEGERLYLCGEFAKAAHSFSNVSQLSSQHPEFESCQLSDPGGSLGDGKLEIQNGRGIAVICCTSH